MTIVKMFGNRNIFIFRGEENIYTTEKFSLLLYIL